MKRKSKRLMEENGSDNEILELAIAREIEAYRFYMAIAEYIDNPEMCQVLEYFAKEELEHKAKLELEVLKTGRIIPIDEELPQALPGNDIASNTDATFDLNYKDILLMAIEKEEASFRTYINLLSTVHDHQSRETLLAIAMEEVKHKQRFEIEYDQLLKRS